MTMMGWILLAIAGVVLAGFATFEAVKSSVPDSAQQEQHEAEPGKEEASSQPDPEKKEKKSDDRARTNESEKGYVGRFLKTVEAYEKPLVVLSTVFIAIFTVVLAFATFFLWRATQDLVRGADATAERQLRAYVYVSLAEIRNFGTAQPMVAAVKVVNNGQTPAYKLSGWTTIGPQIQPGTLENPPTVLGPMGFVFFTPVAQRALTQAEYDQIVQGALPIYVYGEISYLDAFSKKRFTHFRLIFTGNGTPPPAGAVLSLNNAPDGNDSN